MPAGRASGARTPRTRSSACGAGRARSTRSLGSGPSGSGSCSRAAEHVAALGAITGGQAVQMVRAGLQAIYLSGWQVAADANLAGDDVSRPEPLPGEQRPARRRAPQQRAAARRPDRLVGGPRRHRLARADRRRRRGRLRRPAERVRADEGDDRGGRGRRSLRGSARLGEEVRPPRRQGARPDEPVHPHAHRSAARRRRPRRADACSSRAPTRSARRS